MCCENLPPKTRTCCCHMLVVAKGLQIVMNQQFDKDIVEAKTAETLKRTYLEKRTCHIVAC